MNNHLEYNGMCIDFKSPSNNSRVSKEQLKMKKRYKLHGFRFIIVSDYDARVFHLNEYMRGLRMKCQHCPNQFLSNERYQIHLEKISQVIDLIDI